ncbi:MAG TPA: YcxB family protein [Tepidisphaeraceae bacterium]|nr:YcxB family protein [Tepidisphaeraceae bacterium]
MNINVNYTLTREDWDEALRNNRSWVAQHWAARILLIIIVLLGVMVILLRSRDERSLSSAFFPIALTLLVAVFIWLIISLNIRDFPRASWNSNCMIRRPCTVTLNDAALTISEQYRHSTWQWPAFIRFDATQNLLLLYLSQEVFLPIPKRAFSAADLDSFVQFLIQILPPAAAFEASYAAVQRTLPKASPRAPHVQPLESREFM